MMLAVDVHYQGSRAHVAGVLFDRWLALRPRSICCSDVRTAHAYVAGEFYKRELPCILTLMHEHGLSPGTIIIDGYVYLDGVSTPGLGKYLYDALNGAARVVGVAKNRLSGIGSDHGILRGSSIRPLYITSVSMGLARAKSYILSMHGSHRIPTLLKNVDQACRRR